MKGSFISKDESVMLQGIAVMLMVFHHLFAFPERINVPFEMVLTLGNFHIETILAYWGRICISFFAFVSGYGLSKLECNNLKEGYTIVVKRLKKFYMRLWMVCIVFIPIGYGLSIYEFNGITLIKSVLGLSATYNKEWWYVSTYLGLLILYPFINVLMNRFYQKFEEHCLMATGITVIVISILYSCMSKKGFLCWLLCFVMGMLMVKSNVFESIYSFLEKLGVFNYVFAVVCIGVVFIIRTLMNLNCDYDYLFTPILIFSIVLLLKSKLCAKYIRKVLKFVGGYSTYIWLTHTFFSYYYFQKIIYSAKYSVLIFIWCLLCCITTGGALEHIIQMIGKKFGAKRKRRDTTQIPGRNV